MDERDRHDWERSRDVDRERERAPEHPRGYPDRGVISRGGDEVRSWFGDDEARRRREPYEQRGRQGYDWGVDPHFGANSQRARAEHDWRDPVAHWSGGTRDVGNRDTPGRDAELRYNVGAGRSRPFDGGDYRFAPAESRAYGGGMYAGRGPRNYQRSDDRICEDVNECLTADPRIDASDIDVRVHSGEVTLNGMVDDRRARRLAEEIIEDLPGVRDVRNDLRVGRSHDWEMSDGTHRQVGEQSRQREDGAIGRTGDPQKRDDVTTVSPKDTKR